MGLFSRSKPKIKVQTTKKDGFSGWLKCTSCLELIHEHELAENLSCCPKCNHHYQLSWQKRIEMLSDEGSFVELFAELASCDPLDFVDSEAYTDRLKRTQKKTGLQEAVVTGHASLEGRKMALGVMDFSFMGASMGSVVGEKITRLIEYAIKAKLPVVLVCCSGGARMQESALSLMQMAKTSAALAKLAEAGLAYISICTNPTTGGVTASFAMLGDVILAEPKALIAFAGRRVVEQTIREKLPEDAQTAEFLLRHGMIDSIVPRGQLRASLAQVLHYTSGGCHV